MEQTKNKYSCYHPIFYLQFITQNSFAQNFK